jgi:hypothetical protein
VVSNLKSIVGPHKAHRPDREKATNANDHQLKIQKNPCAETFVERALKCPILIGVTQIMLRKANFC